MNDSLGEVIKNWRLSRAQENNDSLWQFLVRVNPWVFSHHPPSGCFHEHVWCFRGLYFCKGCVVALIGWLVGIILQLGTNWLRVLSVEQVAGAFFVLLLPTLLTSLAGAPRIWKHLARLLLGILMVSAIWMLFVTDQWWVRGVIGSVYFLVKIPLDRYRRRKNEQCVADHSNLGKHRAGAKACRS